MSASLQDDLSALTGEELFNLTVQLDEAVMHASVAAASRSIGDPVSIALADLAADACDTRLIVHAQVARIAVPIREAAAIVYRARFARNHPVRVPGT